jgi:hypothetical protein
MTISYCPRCISNAQGMINDSTHTSTCDILLKILPESIDYMNFDIWSSLDANDASLVQHSAAAHIQNHGIHIDVVSLMYEKANDLAKQSLLIWSMTYSNRFTAS